MHSIDVALASIAIFCATACDYKGPTSLKQTVADMIDASNQSDAGDAATTQSPVKTSPACDQLHADNKHIEAQSIALEPTCAPQDSVVDQVAWCQSTPSGDIGIRLASMHLVPKSARVNRCNIEAVFDLVHIDHKNVRAGVPLGVTTQGDIGKINFVNVNGWQWNLLGVPTLFDFDGDGDPEVFVSGVDPGMGADEWQGADWHQVFTYRNGALKKYPPLATAHFSSMEDVDHDGRPDLRTRGPYDTLLAISGLGGSQDRIMKPIFILHSLPNGNFSANDSIAKKTANDACAKATPFPFTGSGHNLGDLDALAIACARIHGQSGDDVMKKLSTTCKAYFEDVYDNAPDHCPAWAKQIATTTPQVTLP